MLDAFLRAIDALCRLAAWIAAGVLAVLALLGMAEIASRALLNYSIPIAFEYSTYMLAVVMFGGSAWALREGGHIRVNLILQGLSPRASRAVDIAATAFALAVSLYFSYASVLFVAGTFARGSVSFFPSQTPLAWPQLILTVSICLLSLALIARLLRAAIGQPTETTRPEESLEETAL